MANTFRPLPVTEEHKRVGTGGEISVSGPESAVMKRCDQLAELYPQEPYQGHVAYKRKLDDGRVRWIFKFWGAD